MTIHLSSLSAWRSRALTALCSEINKSRVGGRGATRLPSIPFPYILFNPSLKKKLVLPLYPIHLCCFNLHFPGGTQYLFNLTGNALGDTVIARRAPQ